MGALDAMQIGERHTFIRKGRKITFERVPAFGKYQEGVRARGHPAQAMLS